jgi:hypothetical protein
LKPICYVETNYLVGVAKGQLLSEGHGDNIVKDVFGDDVAAVIPDVCFMEAFSNLKHEFRDRKRFHRTLDERARETRRDHVSESAHELATHLEEAIIKSEDQLGEIELYLFETVDSFARDAEWIRLNYEILDENIESQYISDPTDSLILCCILWHARRHPDRPKAFVSANHKDFEGPSVKDLLAGAGVSYFRRTEAAVGWLRSQLRDQASP